MSDLKEAFSNLAPIPWSSIPLDDLDNFLHDTFANAELLLNSVPISSHTPQNGDQASKEPGWRATKASETVTAQHPTVIDERNTDIQKQWGKSIKLGSKENPLGVSVYKTAAHDRHGAWFARRSIHAGLGFTQWKHAMRREFIESVKVKEGPGAGAVRGIAGERRLEKRHVQDLGLLEVWQLSSAFPGPVTPREFNALLMSSDKALGEASSFNPEPSSDNIPRHFVLVSRPTTHDETVPNKDLVQGTYESVEMIREIPGDSDDPESNAVEWIMITRSDPGGGIPKFMVERGTPGSIVADVPKLIDWAINIGELPEWDEQAEDEAIEAENKAAIIPDDSNDASTDNALTPMETANSSIGTDSVSRQASAAPNATQGNSSLLGHLSTAIGSSISPYLPSFSYNTPGQYPDDDSSDSSSLSQAPSDGSTGTYASAPEPRSPAGTARPTSQLSLDLGETRDKTSKGLNAHEKELQKLSKRRTDLETRFAKAREDEEKKSREAQEKDEQESVKAQERRERELKKAEEKYRKEVEKLEERRRREEEKAEQTRVKEERRLEERRKKAREKDVLARVQRERDEARGKLAMVSDENEVMRAQVEELQRENNVLVQRLSAFGESGLEAVKKIREEAEVWSGASTRSLASSHKSKESKDQAE